METYPEESVAHTDIFNVVLCNSVPNIRTVLARVLYLSEATQLLRPDFYNVIFEPARHKTGRLRAMQRSFGRESIVKVSVTPEIPQYIHKHELGRPLPVRHELKALTSYLAYELARSRI